MKTKRIIFIISIGIIIIGIIALWQFSNKTKYLISSHYYRQGRPKETVKSIAEKYKINIDYFNEESSENGFANIKRIEAYLDLKNNRGIDFDNEFLSDLQKELMFDVATNACKVYCPSFSGGDDGSFNFHYECGRTGGDFIVTWVRKEENKLKIIMIFHEYNK